MSWHRFEAQARVDGMTEHCVDGSALQLVTVCLSDGPGELSNELGAPVTRAPVVSYLRPSEARELAFRLLELAELADRRIEGES
jgi:hypothetical protein